MCVCVCVYIYIYIYIYIYRDQDVGLCGNAGQKFRIREIHLYLLY